jgi:hypothetical protein
MKKSCLSRPVGPAQRMRRKPMGAFLPVWIIGAPLVFAVIDMFMTPKTSRRLP